MNDLWIPHIRQLKNRPQKRNKKKIGTKHITDSAKKAIIHSYFVNIVKNTKKKRKKKREEKKNALFDEEKEESKRMNKNETNKNLFFVFVVC